MNQPDQPTRKKYRLKYWIASALLACLFAFAMSYWESMRSLDELMKFASENHGSMHIDQHHPEWVQGFVSKETLLPGYDHFFAYSVFMPIPDDLLVTLNENAVLLELHLDVSTCSPTSVSKLEKQTGLKTLALHARGHQIPLDWLKSLPDLEKVELIGVPLTPEQTRELLQRRFSELTIDELSAKFESEDPRAFSQELTSYNTLALEKHTLTKQDAENIDNLAPLHSLSLTYSASYLEFWQTLSRQSDIRRLTLHPRSTSTDSHISTTELEQIRKLPKLVELTLDVSKSTPETIGNLQKFPNLVTIELNGPRDDVPLEWLKSLPNLTEVTLREIPLPPDRWSKLQSYSQLNNLLIRERRISINLDRFEGVPRLAASLDREHLTQAEAEGLVAIPGLQRLSLRCSSTTPEFWQTLSRHQDIQTLHFHPRSTSTEFRFDASALEHIVKFPQLVELALNISKCAPEKIMQLEKLPNLVSIRLSGSEQEIPLEWLKSMPDLNDVGLQEIPVASARWSDLLNFSQLNDLSIDEEGIVIRDTSSTSGAGLAVSLSREHLTQAEAEALIAISDLKMLKLHHVISAPEFWQTLSRHQKLESLEMHLPAITSAELDQLEKIPTLSTLTLRTNSHKAGLDLKACERFFKRRPDVVLALYSHGFTGRSINRHFNRQPESPTDDE